MSDSYDTSHSGLNGSTAIEMIHVPATVAELKPPKPADIITEAANLLRAHWDDVVAFYQALSGEAPSIHGSIMLDEAACVFKLQDIAQRNGFALLGAVNAATLRRAVRFAYKRNTGIAVGKLEAQNRRLRLEHRRTLAAE
jgi:hypothetical protein